MVDNLANGLATPHETSALHDGREKFGHAQCIITAELIIHNPGE